MAKPIGAPKSLQDFRRDISEVVGKVQYSDDSHQEVTKNGKTAAYLVSPEWFERARAALATEAEAP